MNKIAIGAVTAIILAGLGTYVVQPFGFAPPVGKVLTVAEKANCGITAEVTEGPYYVSGTSALVNGNLNTTQLPGTPIQISGHVYEGLDNSKPVANAKIELWHTDDTGSYHPNSNGDVSKYTAADIALRGFITTDAQGAYKFTSIYPGEYSGRTRHIHVKVTAPGKATVTTQLIIPTLPGDPITFDDDTVSKGLPTCHLLTFDKAQNPETASFDFRL
jgi:protocatechuate 3,4-dioxygenase beta subunit